MLEGVGAAWKVLECVGTVLEWIGGVNNGWEDVVIVETKSHVIITSVIGVL